MQEIVKCGDFTMKHSSPLIKGNSVNSESV